MSTGKTKGKAVESPKKNTHKPLARTASSPKMATKARGTSAGNSSKEPVKFPERKLTADEIAHKQALERFTSALELMNQGQFNRAKGLFERLIENPSREIGERSKVY